ncbi:MAG: hypothetical protein MGG11_18060 [Trichodesmium sp. MAG_R03]|nr:hypothetical protein [Trichodesmium sp. MAG_R03]
MKKYHIIFGNWSDIKSDECLLQMVGMFHEAFLSQTEVGVNIEKYNWVTVEI